MSLTLKDYVAYVKPFALVIENALSIPSIISTTQSAHESRWGNSQLSEEANNYFGMTTDDAGLWIKNGGAVISFPSTEYSPLPPNRIRYWKREGDILEKKDNGKGGSILTIMVDFRKYGSALDSFSDWSKHIVSLYPDAYACAKKNDINGFFTEVGKKYGTDTQYANSCLQLLKDIQATV